MKNILGISAYYHDSAAVLLKDGIMTAGAHEERFTRRRHDSSFPEQTVRFCLSRLSPGEKIDAVAFYDNFSLKRERSIVNALAHFPRAIQTFQESVEHWEKFHQLQSHLAAVLGWDTKAIQEKLFFATHHVSHAASAYYSSPLPEAATLTIDGVGEFSTVTVGRGVGRHLQLLHSIDFPHSLGLFYSAFTHYLGFKVNSGEYKVMGLAPLGEPVFKDKMIGSLIHLFPDGSFELNLDYFRFHISRHMIATEQVARLLGVQPRNSSDPLLDEHKNLAASVQAVLEEAIFNLARFTKEKTNSTRLVVAGGVGLNCSAFGKLRNSGLFQDIFVQPAAGDAGGALGAAQALYFNHLEPEGEKIDTKFTVYSGTDIDSEEAKKWFFQRGFPFQELTESELAEYASKQLAAGKYIGWCRGKMEWGPRALGSRSILASPLKPGVHRDLNLLVKKREDFRPFAPVVLEEALPDLFINPTASPYMTLVFFLQEILRSETAELRSGGMHLAPEAFVHMKKAVIHRDWSARVQSINRVQNPSYYDVLQQYFKLTGCPMLVNTSFNVRGEPIVRTFEEAYRCFRRANLDILIVNNLVLEKEKQPFIDPSEFQEFEPD